MFNQKDLLHIDNFRYLLFESLSDIVWHVSNHPLSILKKDFFALGTEIGPDRTSGGKPFYLSTSRSKVGSYSNDSRGTTFKLNGKLLNSRFKGKSVDYWSKTDIKKRSEGIHEMEDRLYSDKPVIDNARKYILEVNSWLDLKYSANSSYYHYLKEVEDTAKHYGIPYKVYSSYNDYISNKNPRESISDIVDLDTIEKNSTYKFGHNSKAKRLRKLLLFLSELKDTENTYSSYYSSELTLSSDYSNLLRREHNRTAIYVKKLVANILRKLRLKSLDELFSLRIKQSHKMRDIRNDLHHLDYKMNSFIKSMKEKEDYDFDLIYDLDRYFFDGKMFDKLTTTFKKRDYDSVHEIFQSARDKILERKKEIERTFVYLPISEREPEIVDQSWKNDQI
jgi:hypothetical protein